MTDAYEGHPEAKFLPEEHLSALLLDYISLRTQAENIATDEETFKNSEMNLGYILYNQYSVISNEAAKRGINMTALDECGAETSAEEIKQLRFMVMYDRLFVCPKEMNFPITQDDDLSNLKKRKDEFAIELKQRILENQWYAEIFNIFSAEDYINNDMQANKAELFLQLDPSLQNAAPENNEPVSAIQSLLQTNDVREMYISKLCISILLDEEDKIKNQKSKDDCKKIKESKEGKIWLKRIQTEYDEENAARIIQNDESRYEDLIAEEEKEKRRGWYRLVKISPLFESCQLAFG